MSVFRTVRQVAAGNVRTSGGKASQPVSRVLSWTVIPLGPMSPWTSSNLPGSSAGHANGSLFGLAPGGVYHRHELLPVARCALTAPFHPYRPACWLRRCPFCCTFRRLTPPRCYLAPCPVEPGLSSPPLLEGATVWLTCTRNYPESTLESSFVSIVRQSGLIQGILRQTGNFSHDTTGFFQRHIFRRQSQGSQSRRVDGRQGFRRPRHQ